MELKIKPVDKNSYPVQGILIQAESTVTWIRELQRMELQLATVQVYPVPGLVANSIWGCLVEYPSGLRPDIGRHTYCQLVHSLLFIPERATLFPAVTSTELDKLLRSGKHLFHPAVGLVELAAPIRWTEILRVPTPAAVEVTQPSASVFIPGQVKSFQVQRRSAEEILASLEESSFPKREKMEDKPLTALEKLKLHAYKSLFFKDREGTPASGKSVSEHKPFLSWLESLQNVLFPDKSSVSQHLQQDYEDLEKRNQKQLDRLLDLLKNNPEEALKYAIPLDETGTSRGGDQARLDLSKRWFDFSLSGNTGSRSGGSGSAVLPDDAFQRLQNQYHQTAQELIKSKDYQKAAFVYLKLLKNPQLAAQTLENGHLYPEAAAIYLKYLTNKAKAADCYEKANMITNAIELYKELNEHEKVGDLYVSIHKRSEALPYFQKVVDHFQTNHQFVKASLVCRHKMADDATAQALLMKGWELQKDAFQCLNSYFANIRDTKQLETELKHVYATSVDATNRTTFLDVIQYEYDKQSELADPIREMAYEIISTHASVDTSIVMKLQLFDKDNQLLPKDAMRYKISRRQ